MVSLSNTFFGNDCVGEGAREVPDNWSWRRRAYAHLIEITSEKGLELSDSVIDGRKRHWSSIKAEKLTKTFKETKEKPNPRAVWWKTCEWLRKEIHIGRSCYPR